MISRPMQISMRVGVVQAMAVSSGSVGSRDKRNTLELSTFTRAPSKVRSKAILRQEIFRVFSSPLGEADGQGAV